MTSTTVSQHTTQPLNFGPEWLRALSTPDSATSIPSSGGSGSGNIFKFSATKHRYSKDEILALRANVSERLSEDVQNEILENLKDIESVFRPNILDPLALTAPTPEELTKMNALSSYISGRTPGGAGRAGNNSQQSQQDSRNNRGGSSIPNGRGGSRGRGGRDNTYGSNRGNNNNNNSDDNGENGNAGDETSAQSSSWSRGIHHSRGGSFGNRVRSYDDRDQPQTFRRGTARQTSDGWRRSRGDDDDSNEQGDDSSTPVNGSSSWTSRGGPARRGSSNGSMEQRTKSNEKWNYNDDRSGSSNNYESNQQRSTVWRTNSSMSERDLNSRRSQSKRDRMPEWMDDDDSHLNNATFEQDGTFTRSSSVRQNNNDEQQQQQQQKAQSQSTSEESLSQGKTISTQQEEEIKPEKPIQQVGTAIVNVPTPSEPAVSQPKPLVQQTIPSWDDDFDQSDFAATVVEATLAEDHDYSPPISAKPTPRLIPMEPTPVTAPIIPQQRTSVIIDDKQWFYRDPQNTVQGPFSAADMERWFAAGYFTVLLPVKRLGETQFSTIQQLTKELGCLPFRTDVPSLPTTPVHKQQQQQQPIAPEPQKFNPMAYVSSSTSNNPFLDDFSMQQQQQQQQQSRQNVQNPLLFNRQTSMPLSTNDRKPISSSSSMSSQLQAYFNSQQQSSSSSPRFSSNPSNDPAILYQQQLQRSISSTNQPQQQQQSNPALYDDMQRSFRHLSSQPVSTNNSSFYPSNVSLPQQQQQQSSNDIMTRLTQAMQTHGKERRVEQHRHDLELERLKLYQQAEQTRLQRDEEERRKYKLQQELASNRQSNLDQLTKSMENKKQSSMEIDPFLAFQQSIQYQKEQQAKIEAQQAENIRRYQQQYREQPMYQNNWNQQNTDIKQSLNFADIQKQEQEQERRSREAAAFAHQYAKSETLPIPNSSASSSTNKPNSWARTLFADSNNGNSNIPSTSSHILSDHDTNERTLPDSSSYNQQATNAPKSRSATNQQSTPWNGSNASFQDVQRQQQTTSAHSSTSGWGNNFQPTSPAFFWDNQPSSSNSSNTNKPITPWTELKPTSPSTTTGKANPTNNEPTKDLSANTRTQDALSKWTQNQFKDSSKDIDVPTLVQLLKDIDNPGEIMEYVQPYIGSVSKAKEFANDFLAKRNQLIHAEPDLDNERLNELVMAPTSSNDNSISGGDEGFQLASSNGQKKKAKKMKGQKLDVKQLGFIVNNRPEQRDDIDKVPM